MNEEDEEDDDIEPPIDEEVFENTQQLIRRGASRSRSPEQQGEEQPSGSNQAMRLIRRGASRLRSSTPLKRNKKNLDNTTGSRCSC